MASDKNGKGGISVLLLSRRLSKTDSSAGNRSIGGSLVLYWLCMVLAMLAAALLLLSVTGVLSRTARQFGETAALQQSNTAALFTAQMDALAAQGIELSETVGGELERFLARRGLSFDALNDDPALRGVSLSPSLSGVRQNMAQQPRPFFQGRHGAGDRGDARGVPDALRAGTGGCPGKSRGGCLRDLQPMPCLRQTGVRPLLPDLRGSGSMRCLRESIAGARQYRGRRNFLPTGVSCRISRKDFNRRR